MKNKTLGGALIITGTAVGAGMLALPISTGLIGFTITSLVLIGVWILMTYTGLLILEVNLALPENANSFASMAKYTCGPTISFITSISVLLLLYSLTGAYITGSSSLLTSIIQQTTHVIIPHWLCSIAFTLILGAVIWHSTSTVDTFNRFFISIKGIFLILSIALLMPKINLSYLQHHTEHGLHVTLLIIPIFLTSFGYHTVIPSLTNYLGKNVRALRKTILFGATLPFLLYLLWLVCTLGTLPLDGKMGLTVVAKTNSIAQFTLFLTSVAHSRWISFCIDAFTNVAVVTSFLGVSLGLFDLLADTCKQANHRIGRAKTALLTFLPPLIFSFVYPHGFVLALELAAVFVAFLEVILPAMMAYRLRQRDSSPLYQVSGGNTLLIFTLLIGVSLIVAGIMKL